VLEVVVAQLIVRNLSDELVLALKRRAAKSNRSAEEEHREILRGALSPTRRRSFASLLVDMPNVGKDVDFARSQIDGRDPDFG
jgi:plasmid stability protein